MSAPKPPELRHVYPDFEASELLPLPDTETLSEAEQDSYDWHMAALRRMAESIPGVRDGGKGFRVPPLMTALLQSPLTADIWLVAEGRGTCRRALQNVLRMLDRGALRSAPPMLERMAEVGLIKEGSSASASGDWNAP